MELLEMKEMNPMIEKWNKGAMSLDEAEKFINHLLLERAEFITALHKMVVDIEEMQSPDDPDQFIVDVEETASGNIFDCAEWPNLNIHLQKIKGLIEC